MDDERVLVDFGPIHGVRGVNVHRRTPARAVEPLPVALDGNIISFLVLFDGFLIRNPLFQSLLKLVIRRVRMVLLLQKVPTSTILRELSMFTIKLIVSNSRGYEFVFCFLDVFDFSQAIAEERHRAARLEVTRSEVRFRVFAFPSVILIFRRIVMVGCCLMARMTRIIMAGASSSITPVWLILGLPFRVDSTLASKSAICTSTRTIVGLCPLIEFTIVIIAPTWAITCRRTSVFRYDPPSFICHGSSSRRRMRMWLSLVPLALLPRNVNPQRPSTLPCSLASIIFGGGVCLSLIVLISGILHCRTSLLTSSVCASICWLSAMPGTTVVPSCVRSLRSSRNGSSLHVQALRLPRLTSMPRTIALSGSFPPWTVSPFVVVIRCYLIVSADACRRALRALRGHDWNPLNLEEIRQENIRRWETGLLLWYMMFLCNTV